MLTRILTIFALLALSLVVLGASCNKEQPEPPPAPPAPEIDTTTPPPVEPPTPPPPEVKKVTEDQFKTAYFDFDKYNLRSDARTALEANAKLLKDNPKVTVMIEGHCDERGTVEYNLALGEKRARTAMDYLKSLGIPVGRMEIISYGKERPVATGHDEVSWQKNRRAKFTITSQ
ncbi:MAG: peptidoglycan-associated lipoprotein Pal [candidate division Zixibacteria bacterium]|nr:peptidoglycan-associated lipoprotein Pal [candidate division Zixibacteria bacterium]MBU1471765.1 peptidoglycan-associated lipoprotein Pal [candidate division Zixibacteria bacterium]MBU2625137.1 peptidoglycan-associated lipoprotein Pal [candidate division Zixibacteria bacterium]